jgi:hypothetical protein
LATLLYLYVATGLLMALIAVPLVRRWIPPNIWYGFRTPRTLADPRIWYPANVHAGSWLFGLGLVISLAATGLLFLPGMRLEVYALTLTAITLGGVAVCVIQSFRFLRRI